MDKAKTTSLAYIWSNLLKAPFWGMYALLVFILCKDMNATPLQITTLIALKPILSLISPYWSALIHKRPDRLRSNVILGTILGHLPFFFFPFITNPWYMIITGAIFLMMKRGIIPAWMEILKLNLPREKQGKTFSTTAIFSFIAGSILPIGFAKWMDIDPSAWRLLFPLTALCSLAGTLFLIRLQVAHPPVEKTRFSLKSTLLRPWKNSLHLLKTRPDFTKFQIGFMLGGGGLMIMQPALPQFFITKLNLSYTTLAIAIAACKGIGFTLTSKIWAKFLNSLGIYRLSSLVTLLAALFPLLLLLAPFQLPWIYVAYLTYGVMQAGSELSWHLSGPLFANTDDSSAYSSMNIATVGLRGLIAPFLGSMICTQIGSAPTLLIGSGLCLTAALQLGLASRTPISIK